MDQKADDKTIATMLRKPEGDLGKQVAKNLNKSNFNMINQSIEALSMKDGESILEIGFGNGAHIKDILSKAENIRYTGIDFAETMVAEATQNHLQEIKNNQVEIHLASSDSIPFDGGSFDKVLAANTLYFWEKPEDHLQQILKVLKLGGVLSLAIRSKEFMRKLPFVQHGFTMYTQEEAEELIEDSGFRIMKSEYTFPLSICTISSPSTSFLTIGSM